MRYVQAGILAGLVVISGLLYNISQKLSPQAPATAAISTAPTQTPVQSVAQPTAPVQAAPQAAVQTPDPAPARVRTIARRAQSEAVPSQPQHTVRATPSSSVPATASSGPATASGAMALPSVPLPPPQQSYPQSGGDGISRSRSSEPDYSGPNYPNSVTAPQGNYPPPPPPSGSSGSSASSGSRSLTVPAGTPFTVRMLDAISTERNRQGDTFQGSLDEDLQADGVVVARRGSVVHGRVVQARQSGRVSGVAELSLEIDRISTVGGDVQVASDVMMKEAPTSKGRDIAKVGVLTGIGAAIGAIAGGRMGAGIGAGAGATAGTAGVMIERGKPVRYNPEDRVTFRLRAPLTVNADPSRVSTTSSDSDRPVLHRR